MFNTKTPFKQRSLYNYEFRQYKNVVLTNHAKQRMGERSNFTNIVSRIAKCKYGYIDYQGISHLFLQDDNIELIGQYKNYAFRIITILSVNLIQFNHKMRSNIEL